MPSSKQSRGFWPLTKKECLARKVPHQVRRIVPERDGNSVICSLCGATIEKARSSKARPPRAA